MKRWPLRWKIAFYAAALGVVATIAGAATTWSLMRYAEVRALDRRLADEASQMLRSFRGNEDATDLQSSAQRVSPFLERDRLIELRTESGEVRFLSPNLNGATLDDKRSEFHTRRIGDRKFRIGAFRARDLQLWIGGDLTDIHGVGRDIVFGMLGAIPTVLIVVFLGGRWVARQALGPVETIRSAASEIDAHRLDHRLPMPAADDEIAGLVRVLNHTFDRLQRSFEQSIRFSADASHHLKTPIAVLRAGIEEILTDASTPAPQQARADALLHQTHHLTSIAENLLLLARADAGRLDLQLAEFDLREVLAGTVDDLRALAEPMGITVETELDQALPVHADRFSMSLIAQNLIDNAVKYNRARGRVRVVGQANENSVLLVVGNTGDGLPAGRGEHIFERFYRAPGSGNTASGQGLGLSIARELARAHGGDLTLTASGGDWTEFQLVLPRRVN